MMHMFLILYKKSQIFTMPVDKNFLKLLRILANVYVRRNHFARELYLPTRYFYDHDRLYK